MELRQRDSLKCVQYVFLYTVIILTTMNATHKREELHVIARVG